MSTGSRRSKSRKMVASKARNGRVHLDTLETGETIARKVLVFNSTRIMTSTKVCGLKTRDTVRELTGVLNLISFVENTLVTGTRTRNTEEVLSSIKMETDTTVTG